MDAHPDLLVARGDCSAYSGVGDPYLPFRDVMAMLTGDVEAYWAAGSISRDHARRLWDALPLTIQALLTHGASLIGTLLAGEPLLSRVAAALPDRADWLERLQALTERARIGPVDLEQSFLFEQYTNVLRTLADQHPLLLVLDDVHWADNASIGLLFHLGRRLVGTGSKILIACAYRPEEVALGRAGEPHPLETALREFKRTFGDVWVDLDRADQTEGRKFVDAFLDTELNRLGEGFRAALFHRTEGHPLFTVELLRVMQERGDLIRDIDADGAWIEGPTLDWEKLPVRVEAVIEQRVNRLDPELQEIVSVASVEGEVFTAQVVAAVQKMAELALAQGDPALALEIVERLIASAPGMSPGRVITFLWKLKGEALSAMGHPEEACSLLQAAIKNARATGERFLLWRIHASLGRLYCAMNRQSEAEEQFSTARELIEELADTVPDEAVKDNFLQRAYSTLRSSPWQMSSEHPISASC
jgi:tetratricopeptide (TPR) repeat protein